MALDLDVLKQRTALEARAWGAQACGGRGEKESRDECEPNHRHKSTRRRLQDDAPGPTSTPGPTVTWGPILQPLPIFAVGCWGSRRAAGEREAQPHHVAGWNGNCTATRPCARQALRATHNNDGANQLKVLVVLGLCQQGRRGLLQRVEVERHAREVVRRLAHVHPKVCGAPAWSSKTGARVSVGAARGGETPSPTSAPRAPTADPPGSFMAYSSPFFAISVKISFSMDVGRI